VPVSLDTWTIAELCKSLLEYEAQNESDIACLNVHMVIWLASYPRSGNTFFRILLTRLYDFETHSLYSVADSAERIPEDTVRLMSLVGQQELECDVSAFLADSRTHFVKTHNLPADDVSPAIVIVRDGRDAVVSYAHFLLKTESGIEWPSSDLLEATLEQVIRGDSFGGWSQNVNAWTKRPGRNVISRYENMVEDPVNVSAYVLKTLHLNAEAPRGTPPSFQELHAAVPWFFRKGGQGSWRQEMSPRLQGLFLEKHGETLTRLGYSESTTTNGPASIVRESNFT
jgi:hypothetical protein